ncbi:Septin-domain-containing protein [Chlamydoabsidia padenii]|nr:Septin-domain-containing protein [Chlamydoabsidia padenii]
MSRLRKEPPVCLNVMVIGAASSGKTAFIRTLCEKVKSRRVPGTFQESAPFVLQGPLQPTHELYSISMQLHDDHRTTAFTIIDTQGLVKGFALNHQLGFLAKYIDHQLERSLIEESKVKRDTKAHDSRIHACFYFINTQVNDGLADMDRYAIEILSSRVNVIPIIGKADTLSIQQLEQLKANFRKQAFDVYKIPLYGLVNLEGNDDEYSDDDYDDDDVQQYSSPSLSIYNDDSTTLGNILGMLQQLVEKEANDDARAMVDYLKHIPLSVFAYEEDKTTGQPLTITTSMIGDTTLGRIYPWAVVDCNNSTHCDLNRLDHLIFTSNGDMLRLDTVERFYEQYRIDQLLSNRVDEMVSIKSKSRQ